MTQTAVTDLFERYHNGDPEALGELLEHYRAWIKGYVRRHMGPAERANETSEDVVQDVFRKAIEAGPAFIPRDEGQFRRIMGTVVLNHLRDRLRWARTLKRDRKRVQPEGSSGPGRLSWLGTSTANPGPLRLAERQEEEQLLHLAVNLLSAEDAAILRSFHLEGTSLSGLASQRGITKHAARMRIARAVGRLAVMANNLREE